MLEPDEYAVNKEQFEKRVETLRNAFEAFNDSEENRKVMELRYAIKDLRTCLERMDSMALRF